MTGFGLALWVAVLSSVTLALWGFDEAAARRRRWRVPERWLLMLAAIGGWPGAKLGQRLFRHKTRKRAFGIWLNLICLLWVGAGFALAVSIG